MVNLVGDGVDPWIPTRPIRPENDISDEIDLVAGFLGYSVDEIEPRTPAARRSLHKGKGKVPPDMPTFSVSA